MQQNTKSQQQAVKPQTENGDVHNQCCVSEVTQCLNTVMLTKEVVYAECTKWAKIHIATDRNSLTAHAVFTAYFEPAPAVLP